MLSVLIPNFEYNCNDLVEDLVNMGKDLPVRWEIIVADDGSSEDIRNQIRPLKEIQNVIYIEFDENIGRARTRNYLAESSQFEYLLFLDCDSKICRRDFLQKYLSCIPNKCVYAGGRIYPEESPAPPYVLHWKYGRIREGRPGLFQSNNFMIPKQIFNKIRFDEKLSSYGHEDTLFAYHIKNLGVPVRKINNPVQHTGLETTEIFLRKQVLAGKNLLNIRSSHPGLETKLSKIAAFLKKNRIHYPVLAMFMISRKLLARILTMLPILLLLDFYKVGSYLEDENREKQKRKKAL